MGDVGVRGFVDWMVWVVFGGMLCFDVYTASACPPRTSLVEYSECWRRCSGLEVLHGLSVQEADEKLVCGGGVGVLGGRERLIRIKGGGRGKVVNLWVGYLRG